MKKKVLSVIAIAVASTLCCLALAGCGGKSIELGKAYNESIGAGTKVEVSLTESTTTTYYVDAKLYTVKIEEKGLYTVSVDGPGITDIGKKSVTLIGLWSKENAKGLSASLIVNAQKDTLTGEKESKNVEKMNEYAKTAETGALGVYTLEAGTYTFAVTSSNVEKASIDFNLTVSKKL